MAGERASRRRRREMLIKAPMLNTELHKNLITVMKHVYDGAISIRGTRVSRSALCNVPKPGANHRPALPQAHGHAPLWSFQTCNHRWRFSHQAEGLMGVRGHRETLSPLPPPPPPLTPSSPSIPSSPFIFVFICSMPAAAPCSPSTCWEWSWIHYSSPCVCVC